MALAASAAMAVRHAITAARENLMSSAQAAEFILNIPTTPTAITLAIRAGMKYH